MPRPRSPPTLACSSELKGNSSRRVPLSSQRNAFELPPPAMAVKTSDAPKNMVAAADDARHVCGRQSVDTTEGGRLRQRISPSTAKTILPLPPPPTRARKIIQMKPKAEAAALGTDAVDEAGVETTASKKKHNGGAATTAAGRKMARKTAHSLIERRRRSKMNEEFGVLKDMIPACTGDMHKLSILQASIEYIRYLEDCVHKLRAAGERVSGPGGMDVFKLPPPPSLRQSHSSTNSPQPGDDHDHDQVDTEMGEASPYKRETRCRPSGLVISPALHDQAARPRQGSCSTASGDPYQYSCGSSTAISPCLVPEAHEYARSTSTISPYLPPMREMDQEATAALLMLNARQPSTKSPDGSRGMSVKDLLSS